MTSPFDANSVAVVGASPDTDKIAGIPVHYLQEHDFDGEIFPVNPNHDEVLGLPCYDDIDAVPTVPDLAVLVIPAGVVEAVTSACFEAGVPTVLVTSSGFSETGTEAGRAAEERLATLAEEHEATLIGPNSQGLIDLPRGLAAAFTPVLELEEPLVGSLGFVTQSGAFGGAVTTILQENGVGLHNWIATGNEAQTGAAEVLEEMCLDHDTSVIAGYVESIEDGRRLVELRHRETGRETPIALLKVGRSERGKAAVTSHTGKIAGEYRIYESVFRELGIIAVDDVDELVDVVSTLDCGATAPGNRIGVVSTSGGAGVHIADLIEPTSLEIPDFDDETTATIESLVPEYGSAVNPVDITAQVARSPDAFLECLTAVDADPNVDVLLLQITNLDRDTGRAYADRLATISAETDTPLFVCWTGGIEKDQALARYREAGISCFENPARCVDTIEALANQAEAIDRLEATNEDTTLPLVPTDPGGSTTDPVLTEIAGKELLAEYGIEVPPEHVVDSPDELPPAGDLQFPAVAKLVSPSLHHRTDVGGIRLGLANAAALEAACLELFDLATELDLDDAVVAVQAEVTGETELALGIVGDSDFGPVLMLGRGGTAVESHRDVTFRTLPVSTPQARSMLGDLGTVDAESLSPAQREEVVSAIRGLSALYLDNWWIDEADVNPLVLDSNRAVAVDALFVGEE